MQPDENWNLVLCYLFNFVVCSQMKTFVNADPMAL
jgi:hypothetical protein